MTKRKFLAMCRQHDLTYGRSDDFRYWTAGSKSYQKIMEAAEELGHDVAARIWNMVVDEKICEDSRKDWYWDVSH
jgi:hypothetical protein